LSNKKSNDRDYLFLSAVIRSREAKMLTREKTEQMLDAGSFEDAARILTDCGYGEIQQKNAQGVDRILSERRREVLRELELTAPDKALIEAFRLRYDYHNAKVLIKAQGANVDGGYLLSDCGRVPAQEIADSFNGDDYRYLPEKLGEAVSEAKSVLARTDNPQSADLVLDQAYFSEFLEKARAVGDPFLADYVRLLIDNANLRTAVRVARIHRDTAFLKTALIPGGNVEPSRLTAGDPGEGLTEAFGAGLLAQAAELGAQAASGGSLTAFELACDNAVTRYLTGAKLVSFGAAPVAAYLAALENEISAARMILTGLLAGIAPDTLRERLRDSYV